MTPSHQPPAPTSPLWGGQTKLVISLVVLVIFGLFLIRVRDIFPLLIISLLIAYLLNPMVDFMERRLLRFLPGGRRALGSVLAFLFAVLVIVLILLVIIPVVALQLRGFVDGLPDQLSTFETRFTEILSQPVSFNNQPILIDGLPLVPLEQLQDATGKATLGEMLRFDDIDLSGALQGFAGSLGGLTRPVFSFLGGAFNTFINVTFFLVMLFYLLKDGRKFVSTVVGMTPPSYQGDSRRMFYETGQIWNAYFRGQLILSSWVGVLVFITTSLIGLPNALVLGLISALLEFVPNIGPFIAMVPAVFVALISTSVTIPGLSGFGLALVVLIIYFTIQQVQAIVVTPRVMGDNLNLHPFLVILAVIAGASLAGALGVILAAPFMATTKLIGMYLYAKLTDRQPFDDWTAPPAYQMADAQNVALLPHGAAEIADSEQTTTAPATDE